MKQDEREKLVRDTTHLLIKDFQLIHRGHNPGKSTPDRLRNFAAELEKDQTVPCPTCEGQGRTYSNAGHIYSTCICKDGRIPFEAAILLAKAEEDRHVEKWAKESLGKAGSLALLMRAKDHEAQAAALLEGRK